MSIKCQISRLPTHVGASGARSQERQPEAQHNPRVIMHQSESLESGVTLLPLATSSHSARPLVTVLPVFWILTEDTDLAWADNGLVTWPPALVSGNTLRHNLILIFRT